MTGQKMLAHTVLFTLKNRSEETTKRLVADCKKYLSSHPGTVFFAAGTLAEDIQWSISDRDFHVALHLVFQDKAAHDVYQDSPEHAEFLDKHSDSWSAIRAIDAYVES
jgi:hypothetical protein